MGELLVIYRIKGKVVRPPNKNYYFLKVLWPASPLFEMDHTQKMSLHISLIFSWAFPTLFFSKLLGILALICKTGRRGVRSGRQRVWMDITCVLESLELVLFPQPLCCILNSCSQIYVSFWINRACLTSESTVWEQYLKSGFLTV